MLMTWPAATVSLNCSTTVTSPSAALTSSRLLPASSSIFFFASSSSSDFCFFVKALSYLGSAAVGKSW